MSEATPNNFVMANPNRIIRHGAVAFIYALLAGASLVGGYVLRFDFAPPGEELREMAGQVVLFVALKLGVMFFMGQFDSLLTFFSVPDFRRIVRASLLAGAISGGLWVATGGEFMPPRSVIVLDGLLFTGMLCGLRLFLRFLRERWESFAAGEDRHLTPVAIMGAGEAGARLAQQCLTHSGLGLKPAVFLDDNPDKWGQKLHGVPVVGGPSWLLGSGVPAGLRRVIIAMPSAPRKRVRDIIEKLEGKGFQLETVQSFADTVQNKTALARLRPIQIDDLLGRDAAQLDSAGIRQMLQGQVVAVTGAGGSIGSELCRQVLRYQPQRLLLIEQSEAALFVIEQELIERGFRESIVPLVADICDGDRINGIFAEHRPAMLFHAAAHKHVPMMESQPVEAIKNNAFGSARLGQAALRHGIKKFVLISTDKAINPTSVMGATKRMAEMFLQALGLAYPGRTRFVSVRFGNVLGSSGSVVTIFQKQIAAGGPVKVTHPDVTRYFMTIPEAVGLVLQSGTMGAGGEIFLLDMGKPVKIVDLAKKLILLQGLKPDEDVGIQFTGLRPGEKMFEELNYNSESTQPTGHAKVFRLSTTSPALPAMKQALAELERHFATAKAFELKREMTRLVPEYKPNFSPAERESLRAADEGKTDPAPAWPAGAAGESTDFAGANRRFSPQP